MLPRPLGAAADAHDLGRPHGASVLRFLGTDIMDAFHLIPISPRCTSLPCVHQGRHFTTFGSLSSGRRLRRLYGVASRLSLGAAQRRPRTHASSEEKFVWTTFYSR